MLVCTGGAAVMMMKWNERSDGFRTCRLMFDSVEVEYQKRVISHTG